MYQNIIQSKLLADHGSQHLYLNGRRRMYLHQILESDCCHNLPHLIPHLSEIHQIQFRHSAGDYRPLALLGGSRNRREGSKGKKRKERENGTKIKQGRKAIKEGYKKDLMEKAAPHIWDWVDAIVMAQCDISYAS